MQEYIFGSVESGDIHLSPSELSARAGKPLTEDDAEVSSVKESLLKIATPKYIAARVKILGYSDTEVIFSHLRVESRDLVRYFKGARECYVFIATLGSAVDRLVNSMRARSLSSGFMYNAVASAMIEAVCDTAHKRLGVKSRLYNRFSPGYGDVPLTIQADLIRILEADKRLGITLSEKFLMTPLKTVTAFIGVENEKED